MLRFANTRLRLGLTLAPMAGITDSPFRRMCKSYGAELVFSEMVSTEGIKRRNKKTLDYLFFTEEERPIAIQIFGSKIDSMKEAAEIIGEKFCPDLIDINLGCPVKKIARTGAGAALLKDLKKLHSLVGNLVQSVGTPVSAKIRLGWDKDDSIEISKILEDSGITLLTVHARKAVDGYNVKADWNVFETLKKNLSIPVIANGDITEPEDVKFLIENIGIDGVMIGRGAIGRPWIFKMVNDYMVSNKVQEEPSWKERIGLLLKHIELMRKQYGDEITLRRIKRQIVFYLKKHPFAKQVRNIAVRIEKLSELIMFLQVLKKE